MNHLANFDRATKKSVEVVLETGGWKNILEYVTIGLGVGLVTQSALDGFNCRQTAKLSSYKLSAKDFRPEAVHLIARKDNWNNEAELNSLASALRQELITEHYKS